MGEGLLGSGQGIWPSQLSKLLVENHAFFSKIRAFCNLPDQVLDLRLVSCFLTSCVISHRLKRGILRITPNQGSLLTLRKLSPSLWETVLG